MRVIPYRLPELLADPKRVVMVVEGEKDVENLLGIDLVATCNAGGAGKWTDMHSKCLKDRAVVRSPRLRFRTRHEKHITKQFGGY